MSKSLVTINLVVLNGDKYILHCLDGVLAQTYLHELIEFNVLDNGSSDGTKSVIENFKLKIKNLGNYYLIVSRLYKHKNIDVAVEAFSKLRLPLVIIGTGPEKESIQNRISGFKNIKMLGFIPDEELGAYYQNCRAFIMPQEEDFGITPIEAMSFGKPVLALRKGGATETVVEGVTGEFFDDPIPEALADGVRRLNGNYPSYSSEAIKMHAQKFSSERFRKEILKLIDRV